MTIRSGSAARRRAAFAAPSVRRSRRSSSRYSSARSVSSSNSNPSYLDELLALLHQMAKGSFSNNLHIREGFRSLKQYLRMFLYEEHDLPDARRARIIKITTSHKAEVSFSTFQKLGANYLAALGPTIQAKIVAAGNRIFRRP